MGTFEMKSGKVLPVLCLVALGVGVLLINLFWVPDNDALMYAFGGMNTTEQSVRVASIGDIVRQQMVDYVIPPANGRVFIHGLCAVFMGFKLYTLFKLLNAAMWILFTWLVLRTGGLTREKTSLWGWAFGAAVVWWVCWYGETAMNAAYSMNYLWTATATLILFALWKRLKWWMVPFAFLYGWSQECFVLPALAALGGSMVVRSIVERRRAFTLQQALAWLLIFAGACCLCLSPASGARVSKMFADGITPFVLATLRMQGSFALLLWAPILFVCLLVALWRKRRECDSLGAFGKTFLPSLEWWLYLVASYGLFLLTGTGGQGGYVRLAFPTCVAVLILALRYRQWMPRLRKLWGVGMMVVLGWLGVTVYLQFRVHYQSLSACVQRYCEDPQGITFREHVPVGLFVQSFWRGSYHVGGRIALRIDTHHEKLMTIFAPWLYHTLYLNPEVFFAEAEAVPGTRCFFSPKAPRVLVAKGDVVPTEAESSAMKVRLTPPKKVISKWIPGRLYVLFKHEEDMEQNIPSSRFVFTAKDGKVYTIFSGEGEGWR